MSFFLFTQRNYDERGHRTRYRLMTGTFITSRFAKLFVEHSGPGRAGGGFLWVRLSRNKKTLSNCVITTLKFSTTSNWWICVNSRFPVECLSLRTSMFNEWSSPRPIRSSGLTPIFRVSQRFHNALILLAYEVFYQSFYLINFLL